MKNDQDKVKVTFADSKEPKPTPWLTLFIFVIFIPLATFGGCSLAHETGLEIISLFVIIASICSGFGIWAIHSLTNSRR